MASWETLREAAKEKRIEAQGLTEDLKQLRDELAPHPGAGRYLSLAITGMEEVEDWLTRAIDLEGG